MDTVNENVDPSKLSLKERIKFFASKSKQAPPAEKPLSPTRAALATSRVTRSLAGSLVNGFESSKLAPGKTIANGVATAFARGTDKELADELVGGSSVAAKNDADVGVSVTLPGGSLTGLGIYFEKNDSGLVILGVDPEGIAGRAGIQEGWFLTNFEGVSVAGLDGEEVFTSLKSAFSAVEGGKSLKVDFKPPLTPSAVTPQ